MDYPIPELCPQYNFHLYYRNRTSNLDQDIIEFIHSYNSLIYLQIRQSKHLIIFKVKPLNIDFSKFCLQKGMGAREIGE